MPNNRSMNMSKLPADAPEFSSSEIRQQMDRILNSPEFNATDAQKAFFKYVVEKTLAGLTDGIKGYAVATEVFGRREDFDQATDPIVSIQANKLRRVWLDMFQRQDYQQAYVETLCFSAPNLFWDHLIKAATLGQLGRIQKGRLAADRLLELKPDFVRRGNVLIRSYIKFDDIVEGLIAALGRVGIDVVDM